MSEISTLDFGEAPTGADSALKVNSLDRSGREGSGLTLVQITGGSVGAELGLGDPDRLWLWC